MVSIMSRRKSGHPIVAFGPLTWDERDERVARQGPPEIEVAGVVKDYPLGATTVRALDDIAITVAPGEFVSLVGPSGCGKSTLLRIVAGLEEPTAGRVTVGGGGRRLGASGYMPQRDMLLPWRTVLDNVTYGMELGKSMKRAQARDRARELLDVVGLSGTERQYPGQLSGGMQQRVNLARALAVQPELLLLDEPFASIDAQTREVMQAELLRICAGRDVTALFVTHDITEAAYLADRVVVFSPRPGRIVAEVTVPFDRPREQRLRRSAAFLALVDEIAEHLYGAAGSASRTRGESR